MTSRRKTFPGQRSAIVSQEASSNREPQCLAPDKRGRFASEMRQSVCLTGITGSKPLSLSLLIIMKFFFYSCVTFSHFLSLLTFFFFFDSVCNCLCRPLLFSPVPCLTALHCVFKFPPFSLCQFVMA